MRFFVARPPRGLRVARLGGISIPGDVDLDGGAIDRPEMEGTQIVSGGLHLDRAEAADEKVFEDLLEDGAEAVADVRLLQAAAQDLHARLGVRHLRVAIAAAQLDLPVHAGDLVLDDVDRAPRHGRLGKLPQVRGSRLGCRILSSSALVVWTQDRGQHHRLSLTFGRVPRCCIHSCKPLPCIRHSCSKTHVLTPFNLVRAIKMAQPIRCAFRYNIPS